MDADTWKNCKDPYALTDLAGSEDLVSPRKQRLLAAAMARSLFLCLATEAARAAVPRIAAFADGKLSSEEAQETAESIRRELNAMPLPGGVIDQAEYLMYEFPADLCVARALGENPNLHGLIEIHGRFTRRIGEPEARGGRRTTREVLRMVRDIYGNPFWKLSSGQWLGDEVRKQAENVYQSFDGYELTGLPELGRALDQAGCQDSLIIDHCRKDRPHFLGCWVLDLILGKC